MPNKGASEETPNRDTLPVPSLAGLSARAAQAALVRAFGAVGIEEPARDARLLVLAALKVSAQDLVRDPERLLSDRDAAALAEVALRRLRREPVSRIIGVRGFYGRDFLVTPATLDPRPCTETVIEAALEIGEREGYRGRSIRILDVGTGSGALLITLLAEMPLAQGLGTDISEEALETARTNAERLGVGDRAAFLNRRTLEGVEGPFDMLVSNPPYIPTGDIVSLEPEVRQFDPRAALDGGPDGLDIYRGLAQGLAAIVPDGWAFFEVGAGQAEPVGELLREALGGAEIRMWTDLGQHRRCVAVRTQR